MGRQFWRSDVKKAIWQRLTPFSRAVMMDTLFPNLSEMIIEELIIGERLFECPEITVNQIIHYKLKKHIYAITEVLLIHDDPVKIEQMKEFVDEYSIYSRAVKLGSWKIAKKYELVFPRCSGVAYLKGALHVGDVEMIKKHIEFAGLCDYESISNFDSLKHIVHIFKLNLNFFVARARTIDDAKYILQLYDSGYFTLRNVDAEFCRTLDVYNTLQHIVIFRRSRITVYGNVPLAKYYLSTGQLNITDTWNDASATKNFEMLRLLKDYHVDVSQLIRDAILMNSMRLLRFGLSLGAEIDETLLDVCLLEQRYYMHKFLKGLKK